MYKLHYDNFLINEHDDDDDDVRPSVRPSVSILEN